MCLFTLTFYERYGRIKTMEKDKSILLKYKTMRKCLVCKEFICLEDNLDSIYHTSKGVSHLVCLEKQIVKKCKGNKEREEKLIGELYLGMDKSGDEVWNLIVKNHLYKYLQEKYECIMLSTYMFTKMEQIYTGKWRGMSKAIKPEHLLEMFERKQKFLDGIYHKEPMSGLNRINYDLAVLNKYQDFLDWKEKDKKEASETISFIETRKVNFTNISQKKMNKNIDLLDEEN
jgi:hypothetical protein